MKEWAEKLKTRSFLGYFPVYQWAIFLNFAHITRFQIVTSPHPPISTNDGGVEAVSHFRRKGAEISAERVLLQKKSLTLPIKAGLFDADSNPDSDPDSDSDFSKIRDFENSKNSENSEPLKT